MIHFGKTIKTLAECNGMSIPELARRLGKTKPTVYEMLEKEDVNTAILKQVADIFCVPLKSLFEEEQVIQNNTVNDWQSIVLDQQRTIKYLRERLEILEGKGAISTAETA